jgi:hypothetical protein
LTQNTTQERVLKMDGFTVVCHDCQNQSEFESKEERVTESIKVFIHSLTTVCLYCSKCGQKLELS